MGSGTWRKGGMSMIPLFLCLVSLFVAQSYAKQPYIVYMGSHTHGGRDATLDDLKLVTDSHHELLASYVGDKDEAKNSIIYSYNKYINGFAAQLEEDQAKEIAAHPKVVSVFPDGLKTYHTTHSWDMMRLERDGRIPRESLWNTATYGSGIIVANIDGGVWPESSSFHDADMLPPPPRWRGTCVDPSNVPCNGKLIGSRLYNKGMMAVYGITSPNTTFSTPRDQQGHGTHTLATAAGGFVRNASGFGGLGFGVAKGGAPGAWVASYKACWPTQPAGGCTDSDILAAMDDAIHDGVDVLSLSLGGAPTGKFDDSISIGTFHAVQAGIPAVCSAGNDGNVAETVSNGSPWIFTVGASTLDRELSAIATTDNGDLFYGRSQSEKHLKKHKNYHLVRSEDTVISNTSQEMASRCIMRKLDPSKVRNKIVVCMRGGNMRLEKSQAVMRAGGVGMILVNSDPTIDSLSADPHLIPAVHINYEDGKRLLQYLSSTETPMGTISPAITVNAVKPHPQMANFSSRGPNKISPEVLKPDVTAPGVMILAAVSQTEDPYKDPTFFDMDGRLPAFRFFDGTSMACPHVAGTVALLKSLHPDWSPAALRSAVMTTARNRDNTGKPIKEQFDGMTPSTPFAYGAGHIRPNHAADPGLVYDITIAEYLEFLCATGSNTTDLAPLNPGNFVCPEVPTKPENLNYPSITMPNINGTGVATRRLKNVGQAGRYTVRVEPPHGFHVRVEPQVLEFDNLGDEKQFEITVRAKGKNVQGYRFGSIVWSDGIHHVRSPVVVKNFDG